MPTQPNVLFITTDHQRADSIGMTQAGVEVTPRLNRFAAESAHFSRAYTTCPLCTPARTALATGLYPARNGTTTNDWKGVHAGDHKPMHQYLAESGYRVGHVGMQHISVKPPLPERVAFEPFITRTDHAQHMHSRGLTNWPADDMDGFRKTVTEKQGAERKNVTYSSVRAEKWPHDEADFVDTWFAQQAQSILADANDAQPWALFVNLWAPHPPLWVPDSCMKLFDPAKIDLPANINRPAEGEPSNRRAGIAAQLAEGFDEAQWRKTWAGHLALTHLADRLIGGLLDTVEGMAGETAVFVMSDHGDHLGQHRMYQKMEMYEQALRVPLMIRMPGAATVKIDTPVTHLDILPTLLDLIGASPEVELDGRSLLGAVRGETLEDAPAFSLYNGNPVIGDRRRSVTTRRWKYIHDPEVPDEPELYDLETDPLEMVNRAGDPALMDVRAELHALARAWAEQHNDADAFA